MLNIINKIQMRKIFALLFVLAISLFTIQAQENQIVEPEPTVEAESESYLTGTQYMEGENQQINQVVKGDVYFLGENLDINKDIQENLYSISGNLNINARVRDSGFIIAQKVLVADEIKENAFIIASDLTLNGEIGADLNAIAKRVLIKGKIKDDVRILAQEVYIDVGAEIDGEVAIKAARVMINPGAKLQNEIVNINEDDKTGIERYISSDTPVDLSLASLTPVYTGVSQMLTFSGLVFLFSALLSYGLFGALVFRIFGSVLYEAKSMMRFDRSSIETTFKNSLAYFGGFAILLTLLLITVIGWPLAIMFLFAMLMINMISKILVMSKIGEVILKKVQPNIRNEFVNIVVGGFVSTAMFLLLLSVPILGGIIVTLAAIFLVFWSTGSIVTQIIMKYKKL